MDDYLLTTDDNPYNPHTQFDQWFAWDVAAGYNTTSFLARVAKTSDSMSESDADLAVRQAIDEIVEYNVLGIYSTITRSQVPLAAPKSA